LAELQKKELLEAEQNKKQVSEDLISRENKKQAEPEVAVAVPAAIQDYRQQTAAEEEEVDVFLKPLKEKKTKRKARMIMKCRT